MGPVPKLFGNEMERQGFEYFEHKSASSLGPGLGWPSWGEFVLRNSDDCHALRHTVIALGAIHKHELKGCQLPQKARNQELLTFAYSQYDAAIRRFRTDLQIQSIISQEQIMLMCILLTIFDFVQGDDMAAATHLKGGLTIFRKSATGSQLLRGTVTFRGQTIRTDKDSSTSIAGTDFAYSAAPRTNLQRQLAQVFAYLDFWSLVWSNGEPLFPEITLIDGLTVEPVVCDRDELQLSLRSFVPLEYRIHELLRAAKAEDHSIDDENSKMSSSSTKQDLIRRLVTWHSNFPDACLAKGDNLDEQQRLRIHIAHLNYKKIRTMLLACQEDGSSDYRAFDSVFRDIVSMSTPMVNSKSVPQTRSQVFAFTPGIIHPLYITATSCCDVETCEQAIGLLQLAQWTEGVWNSTVMAKIARRKLRYRNPLSSQPSEA